MAGRLAAPPETITSHVMKNIPVVTRNLLLINIGVFLLTLVLRGQGVDLNDALGLHFYMADSFNAVQAVTYMFLHADFTHLLFNMFSLWMFGSLIERTLGTRRFLAYYFICGIGAALCQEVWQTAQYYMEGLHNYELVNVGGAAGTVLMPMGQFLDSWTTIGASGACYGVLLAFGMLYPDERIVLLIPPIPMKAKYFVTGYAVIELLSVYFSSDNIAHFAHLGGMLFGYLYFRFYLRRAPRRAAQPWGAPPSRPAAKPSFGVRFMQRVRTLLRLQKEALPGTAEHAPHRTADQEYNLRQRADEARMDSILDKIKRSGYDALTEEEKRDLFRISRK